MMSIGFKSQVLLKITSLPEETPENGKIFMANSLNNWNPNDPNFELKKIAVEITPFNSLKMEELLNINSRKEIGKLQKAMKTEIS